LSIHISSLVWRIKGKLTKAQKLVALALADTANDDGECWPRVRFIADKAEVDRREVRNYMKAIVAVGLLTVVPRYSPEEGDRTVNLYRWDIEALEKMAEPIRKSWHSQGGMPPPGGGSHSPEGGGNAGGDQRIEPLSEPLSEPLGEPLKTRPRQNLPVSDVIESWNDFTERTGLNGTVQKLTPKRQQHLQARLKDAEWLQDFKAALLMAEESDFLMGRKGGWHMNFDWIIRPDSVQKILEGQYSGGVEPPEQYRRLDIEPASGDEASGG